MINVEETLRFAVIGAGYIAGYHTRGILAQPNAEVAVVCDIDEQKARNFAKLYKIPDVVTDPEVVFSRSDIDAVVLCVPNAYHAPFAIKALEQGKDVLIEKPATMTSSECDDIYKAARENEGIVLVGHMWRFDIEAQFIKNMIESGQLGPIFKTKGYGIHENWGPEGWFVNKKLAGGGALIDMGVHAIDTVRYLLGEPKAKRVFANISTRFGDYDVDDSGLLWIEWETGAVSIIESGWWQPHMDGPEAGTQLFGEKGYASLFPTKVKLKLSETPGEFNPAPLDPPKQEHCDQSIYTAQMEYFVECVKDRVIPVPGIKEGQAVVRIVEAAYRSSISGMPVEV